MIEIIGNHISIKRGKTFNIKDTLDASLRSTNTAKKPQNLVKPGYIYTSFEDFSNKEINIKPYPEQLKVGSIVFGELCSVCNTPKKGGFLCSNCRKFSGQKDTLIGCAGTRGGKTILNCLIGLYFLHQLLAIDDIPSYFNVSKNHKLNFIFASSFGILEAEWEVFYDLWKSSSLLTSYKHTTSNNYIEYDNISCFSTDSLSLSYPLVFVCFEDYSWEHPTVADNFKLDIDKNMNKLKHNINSTKSFKPLVLYTGSAKEANDPLMSMINIMSMIKSNKENVHTYHYTTWEMNPNVTRQDLNLHEQNDFNKFRRDFGSLKI